MYLAIIMLPSLFKSKSYVEKCKKLPARSQIILKAAGSEIDLSWQQQLLTIRVCERSGVILTGARSGFFKSQSVVVFTRSKSAPPPLHHEYNSRQHPEI